MWTAQNLINYGIFKVKYMIFEVQSSNMKTTKALYMDQLPERRQ